MWTRTVQLVAIISLFIAAAPVSPRPRAAKKPTAHRQATKKDLAPKLPCGDYLGFQVLLDRQGFSPGVIDGKPGNNFSHAMSALADARHLEHTAAPDCNAWRALGGGDPANATIATYTITDEDVNGDFVKTIPPSMMAQAKLPALNYRTPLEKIAERFHASPALLHYMNPNLSLKAGATISVPNVKPFDVDAKPAADPMAPSFTVEVARQDSALRILRQDGSIVFFAPVTTGSVHDPLPIGDWKVTEVQWRPVFHYNPKLFWDAKATDAKTTLKPGPNNPVGVVWIGINKEHYGLHGTPEPQTVGHAQSHGCVRLTNWDAARVTALVQTGTRVQFR